MPIARKKILPCQAFSVTRKHVASATITRSSTTITSINCCRRSFRDSVAARLSSKNDSMARHTSGSKINICHSRKSKRSRSGKATWRRRIQERTLGASPQTPEVYRIRRYQQMHKKTGLNHQPGLPYNGPPNARVALLRSPILRVAPMWYPYTRRDSSPCPSMEPEVRRRQPDISKCADMRTFLFARDSHDEIKRDESLRLVALACRGGWGMGESANSVEFVGGSFACQRVGP